MVTCWMCKKKTRKGVAEGVMDSAQRSASQWGTNLTYYLSGESKANPSISDFVLNLKPFMGAFVSGNYWLEQIEPKLQI